MADQPLRVILRVDTHADAHVAYPLDQLGHRLGILAIPTTRAGCQQLLDWTGRHGQLTHAGVEGTGTDGARLARFLTHAGVQVIEVDGPTVSVGAGVASRIPLTPRPPLGRCWPARPPPLPRPAPGIVESIRVLRVARAGALKARTQAANQLRDLLVTASEELHAELYPLSTAKRVQRLAAQQPSGGADPASATRRACAVSPAATRP